MVTGDRSIGPPMACDRSQFTRFAPRTGPAKSFRAGRRNAARKMLMNLAFETPGIERVEISAAAENERSRRLVERPGFRLEGILQNELKRREVLHGRAV